MIRPSSACLAPLAARPSASGIATARPGACGTVTAGTAPEHPEHPQGTPKQRTPYTRTRVRGFSENTPLVDVVDVSGGFWGSPVTVPLVGRISLGGAGTPDRPVIE